MKRRTWLAAIGALLSGKAVGQELTYPNSAIVRITNWRDARDGKLHYRDPDGVEYVEITNRQHANGECPVCSTIAAPYRRQTEAEYYAGPCLPSTDGSTVCRVPSQEKLAGPTERIVRCAHCNAAFWQDAEK